MTSHGGLRAARDLRAFALARRERLGERDRDREARERADEQQQPLAQAQPARGAALGGEQEVERGELDDTRAPAADQVDRDRHADRDDAGEHQRREESEFMRASAPVRGASARTAARAASARAG